MNDKPIILTVDYELFFGSQSGTVEQCMIHPTDRLSATLRKSGGRMTVFWDVLHYIRLRHYEGQYPVLKQERQRIEDQVRHLVREGHDIQLHLHPHWITSTYEDDWKFSYEHYSLNSLTVWERDADNPLKSVEGCFRSGIKVLNSVIRPIDPNYRVRVFRAGGWCIEPFINIGPVMRQFGISIDSSVAPRFKLSVGPITVDFSTIRRPHPYRFESSTLQPKGEGFFMEFPIYSYNRTLVGSVQGKMLELWYRLTNKREITIFGDGTSAGYQPKSFLDRSLALLAPGASPSMMTLESLHLRWSEFKAVYRNGDMPPVMIGHPKALCEKTMSTIERATDDGYQFISLRDYLSHLGNQK